MFEEKEAWEAGFRAGLKLAEEAVGPLSIQPQTLVEALESNPYASEPEEEPEPEEPAPNPLPPVLEPTWRMLLGPEWPAQVVHAKATWDPQWQVYRWIVNGDPQACGSYDVDWLFYHRPHDEAWLTNAVHELSPAEVWVKPVDGGWHLVNGRALPTFFVSYRWGRQRDAASLRGFLEEHGWPLRSPGHDPLNQQANQEQADNSEPHESKGSGPG